MSRNISLDIENPDGDGALLPATAGALSLLKDAKNYGVALNELENFNAQPPQTELPKQQKKKP